MPTNSILHDVVIEDKEAAKRLVDALEKAEAFSKKQNEPTPSADEISSEE